ncbi:MAG TPA: PEGA domain-containing protein [Kofleriaceae bacterium]|nr:PEGA domain-containing protein [Kofleriaceae bacterium]
MAPGSRTVVIAALALLAARVAPAAAQLPATPAPATSTAPAPPAPGAPPAAPPTADAVTDAPEAALTQRIAVWRIDSLGLDAELVARLETLFRMELDRLAASPLPTRHDLDKVIAADPALASCSGEDHCLAAIGKRLGVEVIVTGTVAAMGDSYILNIKAVDVAGGTQLRRIATEPLRGSPDELIDAIRVAAYRLLAPDQLHGSIVVLSDAIGAAVLVDGQRVGMTPLPGPIQKLSLGDHTLRVEARGYQPFQDTVTVRFQKATRVTVRLASAAAPAGSAATTVLHPRRRPWYSSPWVYAGVGAVAVVAGVVIGRQLGTPDVVQCGEGGCR